MAGNLWPETTVENEMVLLLRKFANHARLCGDDLGRLSVGYFRIAAEELLSHLDGPKIGDPTGRWNSEQENGAKK